jgi:hypothetical protein
MAPIFLPVAVGTVEAMANPTVDLMSLAEEAVLPMFV